MAKSINFFLQWDEYFAAQEFFRRSRQAVAPEWLLSGVLFLVGLAMLFVEGMSLLAAVVLLVGAVVILTASSLRRWTSKRKWQREPLYETEHEVEFRDDGVYFRMGVIESNLDWKYYQRVMESPNGLLMVYGNYSFNFLPKRAFPNDQLLDEFRNLANRNLKSSQ